MTAGSVVEERQGEYLLTTDPVRVDVEAVHAYLTRSYWAEGIPLAVVRRSVANSLCFSLWWDPEGTSSGASSGAGDPATRSGASAEVPRGTSGGEGGAAAGSAPAAGGGRPQQVGFARVISDFATFAYLGDVYVLEAHRGRGLSKWLMQAVTAHPRLQSLRRWCLLTRDAHGLYEQFGWKPIAKPDRYMEKWDPEVYPR